MAIRFMLDKYTGTHQKSPAEHWATLEHRVIVTPRRLAEIPAKSLTHSKVVDADKICGVGGRAGTPGAPPSMLALSAIYQEFSI